MMGCNTAVDVNQLDAAAQQALLQHHERVL
jgi:hypothetical protein